MKLLTYRSSTGPRIGALIGEDRVLDLAAADPDSAFASMQALIDAGEAGLARARDLAAAPPEAALVALAGLKLMAPLPLPQQMRDCLVFERHLLQGSEQHARLLVADDPDPEQAFRALMDSGAFAIPPVWYEQPIYYKCNRFTFIGHEDDIVWPRYSQRLDYELEMAMVIGKTGKNIRREDAFDHIFGFTIYNDVSARDAQFREMPGRLGPAKGKDFDTGNIMGPWIVTTDEFDPYDRVMTARVNGEQWSRGDSGTMHHRFDRILEHISADETLHAGEVIGSGTVGNGCGAEFSRWIQPGDLIELEIEGIGILRNRVTKPN